MKTLFLFNDTETTGVSKKDHKLFSVHLKEQILSFALVLCEKETTLLEKEITIKLKKNVLPHATALLVNNINPFSKEFNASAISEYEGCQYFAKTLLEYKKQGYRIVFIAYNAEYDRNMFTDMCIRCGVEFNALIDVVFDPLLMTRPLVKANVIKTREVQGFGGKNYNSASLEDVYNGLGYSSSAITAHNALEDTKMLRAVTYKAYYLFTSKNMEDADIDESTFTTGEEKTVVIIEDDTPKIKNIKILKSGIGTGKVDLGMGKILILDLEQVRLNPEKIKSCVREIDIKTIFDELDFNSKHADELERYYNQYKPSIDELVEKHQLVGSEFATHERLYFGSVEKLAEKMLKDPTSELDEKEKEILELAEEYSYARFNEGWSVGIKGQNHENVPVDHKLSEDLTLSLDPIGQYILKNKEEVLFTAEKKGEMLTEIAKRLSLVSTDAEYKKISTLLVPAKSFKSVKFPPELIKEFNTKKTEVFNGSNKLHKDTLRDLKEYYQAVSSEAFKELTIPDFKLNLNIFKK